MSETQRRGPYAKSAERRAALATAALDVIKQSGHQAVTTSVVARSAGASERTLFYHFPTRDHLLVAALELADQESSVAMKSAPWATVGVPPYGFDPHSMTFERIVATLALRDAERPWKVRLAVALSAYAQDPDHPAHDYFVRHNAYATEQFARLMVMMQRRGDAHPDLDPVRVARRLIAVWDGLQAQWLVTPDFDLAVEVQESFRQLTGQNVMAVRQAIDEVMAMPAEARTA